MGMSRVIMTKNFISKSAYVSKVAKVSNPVSIGKEAEVHDRSELGLYSLLNNYSVIYSDTKVGKYCSIGRFCEIGAAAHPISFLSTSNIQYSNTLMRGHEDTSFRRKVKYEYDRDTIVGHDVWIGAKSVIKSGVTIGHGSVVAALSFVNKDVPPYAIVGGIPAKILKFRFSEEIITDLLELEWWDLTPKEMANIDFNNIEVAIEQIKNLKASK